MLCSAVSCKHLRSRKHEWIKNWFLIVNVNPPLGIAVGDYYVPRFAKGFLDDLEVRTLALFCGNKKILLIRVPVCGVNRGLVLQYCEAI